MARYSRLSERIGQDPDLAELADSNTLAALLFTWSIPAADLYGILPAEPRAYKARVAPAMNLNSDAVEQAIRAELLCGLIEAYNDTLGRRLLYISNYHRYQDIRWAKIGPPEYELPATWKIPQKLLDWLCSEKCDRDAAYYRLRPELLARDGSAPGQGHPRLDLTVQDRTETDSVLPQRPAVENIVENPSDSDSEDMRVAHNTNGNSGLHQAVARLMELDPSDNELSLRTHLSRYDEQLVVQAVELTVGRADKLKKPGAWCYTVCEGLQQAQDAAARGSKEAGEWRLGVALPMARRALAEFGSEFAHSLLMDVFGRDEPFVADVLSMAQGERKAHGSQAESGDA